VEAIRRDRRRTAYTTVAPFPLSGRLCGARRFAAWRHALDTSAGHHSGMRTPLSPVAEAVRRRRLRQAHKRWMRELRRTDKVRWREHP
jgi:hypothetical protein